MKRIVILLFILLTALLIGCNDSDVTTSISQKQNQEVWKTDMKDFADGWVMKTTVPDDEYGTYLGNGYMGVRLFSQGDSGNKEEIAPCYMAGVYGNENLISVPNVCDLRFFEVKNQQLTEFVLQEKNYEQSLDMKTGTLSTTATMKAGKKTMELTMDTRVLRLNDKSCKVCFNMGITPNFNGEIFVAAPVTYNKNNFKYENKGYTNLLSSKTERIWTKQTFFCGINVKTLPDRINMGSTVTGDYEEATQIHFNVEKKEGYPITYVGEVSTKKIKEITFDQWENAIKEHKANWEKLWKGDVLIEGDPEAQQVTRSNMFYLLCSASEDYSIPPMGLSGDSFSGHVFWDSELWMFPALIWQHPELAKGMIKYRIRTLEGAKENAKKNGMKGAQYAWESGETGIETSPDPNTIHERHINGDIAFSIWQYYVLTGDKDLLKEAYPVLVGTADYWISKAEKGSNGKYEIKHICSPDENADIVDNSVYTNAIAQINLWIATESAKVLGETPNSEYMNVANNMFIGVDKDKNRFNIYDQYKEGKIKQADPELLLYPLKYNEFMINLSGDYNFGNDLFVNTFKFYKSKVTENGPSMSASAHAVSSARLKMDDAYSDFTESYKSFMRGYFNYFNEKRSHTYINWCFLTGAGSSYASVPWGFCGLDADYYKDYENSKLIYSNNLPKEWKKVTLTGICYKGKKYKLTFENGNSFAKESL